MDKIRWKKGIACGGFFLLLVGLTLWLVLKDQDPAQLQAVLGQVRLPWLLAGLGAMVVYFLCEAGNLQRGLALFGSPAPYRACLGYGVTGFFFSAVTPSASGGEPMQLYAMYRDGHAPAPGALALLTEFLSFQMAAVTLAGLGFFLHRQQILALDPGVRLCFLVGAGLNLAVAGVLASAMFSNRVLPALWRGLMVPARRLFPRKVPRWEQWWQGQWEDLCRCRQSLRENRGQLGKLFLTSLLQLTAYHSVPFWICLAFGLSGQTLWSVVGLQAVLFLSVSSLPLPGAVGITEGGFLLLYQTVFPAAVLPGAMLLSRAVSFYLVLLCCGLGLAAGFLRGSWRALRPGQPLATPGERVPAEP